MPGWSCRRRSRRAGAPRSLSLAAPAELEAPLTAGRRRRRLSPAAAGSPRTDGDVMSPLEFLARMAAILPAPRLALRRQLGLLLRLSDRRKVMPAPAERQLSPRQARPRGCRGRSCSGGCGTSTLCAVSVAADVCSRSHSSRISPRPTLLAADRAVHAAPRCGSFARPARGCLNVHRLAATTESIDPTGTSALKGFDRCLYPACGRETPPPTTFRCPRVPSHAPPWVDFASRGLRPRPELWLTRARKRFLLWRKRH